jgi:HEAT repeat protein
MRKRFRIAFTILLSATLGVVVWQVLRPREREPIYRGKPLSAWLEGFGPNASGISNGPEREQAEKAVRSIGTNAFPTLFRMLLATDSSATIKVIKLAQKQHLIKLNWTLASDQNSRALSAFAILGAEAVPHLIQIYNHNNSEWRKSLAAYGLASIGPAAKEAIPHLASGATNRSAQVRHSVLSAFIQIHSEPEIVVPIMIKALGDSESLIRTTAALGLTQFGNNAKPAIPALLRLLENEPNPETRSSALATLNTIDPEAAAKAEAK